MNPTELLDIYISELLRKISRDDKIIRLIDDFNRDLLKYDINTDSATFLDSVYTNFLYPYISTPTHVRTHSKTLTDNIFLYSFKDGFISINITTTISDHYAQPLLKKDIKLQRTNKKLLRNNFKNLKGAQFGFELKNTYWITIFEEDKKDFDISFNKFLIIFKNL